MPHLIDGNNLMHALAGIGVGADRRELVELLEVLAAGGQRVCVVFDGPAPEGRLAEPIEAANVEVVFSGHGPADEIINRRIAENTAPRRLTVVSTDREIRAAARRRRCTAVRSEDFAPRLMRAFREAARPPAPPDEPPEKRRGLTPEQTAEWMRRFGYHPKRRKKP